MRFSQGMPMHCCSFLQASSGVYEDMGDDNLHSYNAQGTRGGDSSLYYSTAIHGNYSITPADSGNKFNTIVMQKQDGQKIFSI